MKKIFSLLTTIILLFSLTACGTDSNNSQEPPLSEKPKVVTLTTNNIEDYLTFSGEIKDAGFNEIQFFTYATLDFETYTTRAGTFDAVEITVKADIPATSILGWFHLSDEPDTEEVQFTFDLPSSGEYSSSYKIRCNRLTDPRRPNGNCDFEIVSVSGTFIPTN